MPTLFTPPQHHFQVEGDTPFSTDNAATKTEFDDAKGTLKKNVERIAEQQRKLYAHDRFSLLLIFQAMDAAGKDSTIRAVTSGVNPAGFQVHSFKQPSKEELDHDFLWRSATRLPQRGRIGVFNRSYYEETLVVRVHPEYLGGQRLPYHDASQTPTDAFWQQRFASIRDHEQHLARNGTVVLKFWLNVSLDEQRERFLARLDDPKKHWKFSGGDIKERGHWGDYMAAYSEVLPATSRPWAPWYAIPADSKKTMRAIVSGIIADTLEALPLEWPQVAEKDAAEFDDYRRLLTP